jgi:hypothetical protein
MRLIHLFCYNVVDFNERNSSGEKVEMKNSSQRHQQGQPATYQIQVQGWISERWADWFDDMTIAVSDEDDVPAITTLTGTVADQAALLGLLQKLYTLGLPLLLVRRKG